MRSWLLSVNEKTLEESSPLSRLPLATDKTRSVLLLVQTGELFFAFILGSYSHAESSDKSLEYRISCWWLGIIRYLLLLYLEWTPRPLWGGPKFSGVQGC